MNVEEVPGKVDIGDDLEKHPPKEDVSIVLEQLHVGVFRLWVTVHIKQACIYLSTKARIGMLPMN